VRAPGFWMKRRPTVLARLLHPVGILYGRTTARRMRGPSERAGAPTICVGNFVAGGAGKTPAALALARMLIANGRRVAFLSRGYGGAERVEPLMVDANAHTAAVVGDEPLLLARIAPCWVGTDRLRSARSAVEAGANALVLDDGLQNPAPVKDLAFAVVDGETGFLVPFEPSGDVFGTPADPKGFAAALAARVNELLASPLTARQFGSAGRQRVLRHFTWGAVAKATLEVYEWAMARRQAG